MRAVLLKEMRNAATQKVRDFDFLQLVIGGGEERSCGEYGWTEHSRWTRVDNSLDRLRGCATESIIGTRHWEQ